MKHQTEPNYKAERDELEQTLLRKGYRRCDIPACNCNGWHYGNAEQRLAEIAEVVWVNGQTTLNSVIQLKAQIDILTEALRHYAECSDGCPCGDGWGHEVAQLALDKATRKD